MCLTTVKQKTKDIVFKVVFQKPASITYDIVASEFTNENAIRYTRYGIRAMTSGIVLDEIADLSTDYEGIKRLVNRCNRYSLAIEHFRDVIEDFVLS